MGSLGIVPNLGQIYNPDSFTGNGSNTTFTLTHLVTSDQSIIWVEGGVVQKPGIDFTIAGLTLTRTTAPANLVACFAMYLGVSLDIGTPSDGTITLSKMAVNSVDSDQYVDGSIDAVHLSANSVDSDAYVDLSIDTIHIANNAVDETKLKDALIGDFTDATVTASDYFIHGDATSSGNTKKDTVQGILDLVPAAGGITLGTPVASTSGTAIDFTGIPSGTKRITINFHEVSLNASRAIVVQLGDAGGIEATGYQTSASEIDTTVVNEHFATSFPLHTVNLASASLTFLGKIILDLVNSSNNTWLASGWAGRVNSTTPEMCMSIGTKDLSAELTQVRITTSDATATFDLGEINISYE